MFNACVTRPHLFSMFVFFRVDRDARQGSRRVSRGTPKTKTRDDPRLARTRSRTETKRAPAKPARVATRKTSRRVSSSVSWKCASTGRRQTRARPAPFSFQESDGSRRAATPATVGEVGIWSSTDETRTRPWRASDETASRAGRREKKKGKDASFRVSRFGRTRTIRRRTRGAPARPSQSARRRRERAARWSRAGASR